jgi:hypothetical protein
MEIIIGIAVVLFAIGWFYNRKKEQVNQVLDTTKNDAAYDNGIKFVAKEEPAPVPAVAPVVVETPAPVVAEGVGTVEVAPVETPVAPKAPRAKKPAVAAKANKTVAPKAKKAPAKKTAK